MDTIADLLTRIRNASAKQKDRVDIPLSKLKVEIVRILKDEGFIANYKTVPGGPGGKFQALRVFLKYAPNREGAIRGLRRISKPGLRIYRSYTDIPRGRGGLVVTILSTPKGVVTNKQAKELKVGGEVLCQVW